MILVPPPGLYAGSQTISASMGLATDAINQARPAAGRNHTSCWTRCLSPMP